MLHVRTANGQELFSRSHRVYLRYNSKKDPPSFYKYLYMFLSLVLDKDFC